MSITKQDLTQVQAKNIIFKQLGLPQGSTLDQIISKINTDLNFPLKMSASFPTADSKINFSDSEIISPDSSNRVIPLIQNQIFTNLSSLWIDFQTQAASNPIHFDITWPTTNTVDYYRLASFKILDNGKILVDFSNESSTESALPNPGTVFSSSSLPIGFCILQCTDSAGYFKTAGSTSNVIENNKIFRFDSRASSSISGVGEVNTASSLGTGLDVYKQKSGNNFEFKTLVAGPNIAISSSSDYIGITSPGGEANTASNVGSGEGIYANKVGVDIQFKSLKAGSNVTINSGTNVLTINSINKEVNTASNIGGGVGVFSSKSGVNLPFKSLIAGTNVTITPSTDSVILGATVIGENNTASNVGTGVGVFDSKVSADLRFKRLVSGTNAIVAYTSDSVVISAHNNIPKLGDIVESALQYSDFVASRPDGSTWVPLNGGSIAGSALASTYPSLPTTLPNTPGKFIKIN